MTLAPTMESWAIPTRTYNYLAAGIPLLTIGHRESELRDFEALDVGRHFPPDAVFDIIDFLRAEIRDFFVACYERRLQTRKYSDLIAALRD